MVESMMYTVGNGTVIVERCVYPLDRYQKIIDSLDIEESLLLTSERCIGQVLSSG